LGVVVLIGLMAGSAAIWLAAFIVLRTEIPFIVPELTLFVGFVVPTLERAVSEELAKQRVRGIFERFISPEMVEELIERGVDAARGQRAELTILFSDIRGFTTMSEKMSPEDVVALLNEYLDVMTAIILKHGGTIDKYEGDLIMAFFGAPIAHADHARRAVRAALDMRRELDRLRAKWAGSGGPARFEMGIGINTGDVFVGLIGSSKRFNYTVIGDAVNLASRLQDLTKDVKWPLLISEFTYAHIQNEFDAAFAETRQVKGKTQPVGIYKVLGEKGAPEEERVRPLYA
jgi:adenylate cyclase